MVIQILYVPHCFQCQLSVFTPKMHGQLSEAGTYRRCGLYFSFLGGEAVFSRMRAQEEG